MTASATPRSLRMGQRSSAFLLALVWCAAPVLSVLHAGQEAHRYCAEHGAVEDGGTGQAVEPGGLDPVASDQADPGPAHESCAFAKACRFGQTVVPVVLQVTAGEIAERPRIVPGEIAPVIALLALAPKTSPPV